MSSDLDTLRKTADERRNPRDAECAFCGATAEVSVNVQVRERGAGGKYLTGRGWRACVPCALSGMDHFAQNGGQHE